MAWARPDNLHSRLVFWLKILLPLGRLAILSTLFMVSHNFRPEDAIPYADVDIEDRVNEPRLTAPDFAGDDLRRRRAVPEGRRGPPRHARRQQCRPDLGPDRAAGNPRRCHNHAE